MPPDLPRVEGPLGLRQMYPPVTLKYPLVQKLIETPDVREREKEREAGFRQKFYQLKQSYIA